MRTRGGQGCQVPFLPVRLIERFGFESTVRLPWRLKRVPDTLIPEQKAIVKKLDALAEETKKLATIFVAKIVALEELKKSVLQSAFAEKL